MPEQKQYPKLFTDRFTEPTGGDEHRPFPEAPSCNTEPSENESCLLLDMFKSIFRAVTGKEHPPVPESLVDDVEAELFYIARQEQYDEGENTEGGVRSCFFREIAWEFFNAWQGNKMPSPGTLEEYFYRGAPLVDSPCVESFIGWYHGFNVNK